MDLRNSNGFTLQPYRRFFENFHQNCGKMHHVELNSGTSKPSKEKTVLHV